MSLYHNKIAKWAGELRLGLAIRAPVTDPGPPPGDGLPVTIRYAFPDDEVALTRLAVLDSSEVPAGPLLVAEVEGELRAALSLSGGGVVADPFHRTSLLLELLRARAAQLARVEPGARRLPGWPLRRAVRWM